MSAVTVNDFKGKYQYAVIGAGLSGLIIATKLSQQFEKVILIDSRDLPGGLCHHLDSEHFMIPENENAQSAIDFLNQEFNCGISTSVIENKPQIFHDGKWRPFLGWGASAQPPYYDEVLYYLSPNRFALESNPAQWVDQIFKNYNGEFLPRHFITQIVKEKADPGERGITGIILNGGKKLKADHYIYCGPIKLLDTLCSEENILPPRIRQKIAKHKSWTSISLTLFHKQPIFDSQEVLMLSSYEKKENEAHVFLGQFSKKTVDGNQSFYSQWICFIDIEVSEDSEITGNLIRRMKRQIKKAFPTIFEATIKEKILVSPSSHGHLELKLKENQTIPELPNLWLGSSQISPYAKNMVGSIQQAKMVLTGSSKKVLPTHEITIL